MDLIGTSSVESAVEMERHEEQGFMLVGLIVAIFFVLLALSVAAPKVAQQLRREREVEAVHRGNQYVRAIRLYYRKFGHYPGSMEQLEKTNNIRFLRQKYVDPMTGKADWRLIHFGEAKTKLHGLFGEPLPGMAQGLGSAAGMVSQGQGGAATVDGSGSQNTSSGSAFSNPSSSSGSAFGSSSSGSAFGSTSSSSSFGGSSLGGTSTGSASGSSFGSGGTSNSSSNSGLAGSSLTGTSLTGVGAPIVGIGSSAKGSSILALNDQVTYETWEFLYDPAIEQLKRGFLGGTMATGLGSASGNMSPGQGNSPTSSPTSPTSPSPSPTTTPTTTPQ